MMASVRCVVPGGSAGVAIGESGNAAARELVRFHSSNNSGSSPSGNHFASVCSKFVQTVTLPTLAMCGIVGYVGRSEAAPILLDGLRRLEYRGYDSAGVAIVDGDHVGNSQVRRANCFTGGINFRKTGDGLVRDQSYALGNAWKSHRRKCSSTFRRQRQNRARSQRRDRKLSGAQRTTDPGWRHKFSIGYRHRSACAHLIGNIYRKLDGKDSKARLVNATRAALKQVIGTYGIALVHADIPDFIVGARRGSPLVLGVGKDENFLASDVSAIVAHTRDVVYLNDFDLVSFDRDNFEISSIDGAVGSTRSARSSSPRRTSRRAITRTTCSRKSVSSRTRCATRCAVG